MVSSLNRILTQIEKNRDPYLIIDTETTQLGHPEIIELAAIALGG